MIPSTIAACPGTFDPITRGHEDMVRRAARLFAGVVVVVAAGHHKKTLFSLDERLAMVREVFAHDTTVEVAAWAGLMRDFVTARGVGVMVRGLRTVTDFDHEFQLAGMNRTLMPDVETVFLVPGDRYPFVSSTFVREIALLGGDVAQMVSPCVQQRLQHLQHLQHPRAMQLATSCGGSQKTDD